MTENTHPKAIEAAELAQQARAQRKRHKEIVQAAQEAGMRFVDIYKTSYPLNASTPTHKPVMTVGYRMTGKNVMLISTALCHPHDPFDKYAGRALAAINFGNAHVVALRRPTEMTAREWINHMFAGM